MTRHSFPLLCAAAALAACASGGGVDPLAQPTLRAAVAAPAALVTAEGTTGAPPGTCRSPLYDPADRTAFRLLRSREGLGDYEAPVSKYGVQEGEALRIECASGRPVGIVKR